MNAKLVHQTTNHDFYKIRFASHDDYSQIQVVYNIVPKGDKPPTTGYYRPDTILKIKGYKKLKVFQTFEKTKNTL